MIKGKKVILRPMTDSDIDYFYKWVNDPLVAKCWYGMDKPKAKEWLQKHYQEMLKDKNQKLWIIEADNNPIGAVFETFENNDDNEFSGRIEIDLLVGESSEHGKGYGTDALKTMVKHAFEKQGAERVYLKPRINNPRAIHVYEKAGFKREGILGHYEKFTGEWVDVVMMAIIKNDYQNNK